MWRKILLGVALATSLASPRNSWAQVFSPDFDCSKSDPNDSIQQLLCRNNDAAMAEITFDQAYYALRQVVGKDGWKALKQEAISDDAIFSKCISADSVGTSTADPDCYIRNMNSLTQKYRGRLSGPALEEATRPLLEHRILQQKLSELGFLKAGTPADAVYGESTRRAIETWQRVARRPEVNGFISNDDANALLNSSPVNATDEEKVAASVRQAMAAAANAPPRYQSDANTPARQTNASNIQGATSQKPDTSDYLRWLNIAGMVVFLGAVYLLPTLVAIKRGVHKLSVPVIITVIFGWTLVGWVVALIMGCSMERETDYELRTRAMIQMLNR